MAKVKQNVNSDMNDMDLNNPDAMTDQERENMQMNMGDMGKKMPKTKKSM